MLIAFKLPSSRNRLSLVYFLLYSIYLFDIVFMLFKVTWKLCFCTYIYCSLVNVIGYTIFVKEKYLHGLLEVLQYSSSVVIFPRTHSMICNGKSSIVFKKGKVDVSENVLKKFVVVNSEVIRRMLKTRVK